MDHFYEGVVLSELKKKMTKIYQARVGRVGQAEADEGQLLSVDPLTTLLNDNLP